jgi:hypothetical protein
MSKRMLGRYNQVPRRGDILITPVAQLLAHPMNWNPAMPHTKSIFPVLLKPRCFTCILLWQVSLEHEWSTTSPHVSRFQLAQIPKGASPPLLTYSRFFPWRRASPSLLLVNPHSKRPSSRLSTRIWRVMRIMKKFPPPRGSGGCVELVGTMMDWFYRA